MDRKSVKGERTVNQCRWIVARTVNKSRGERTEKESRAELVGEKEKKRKMVRLGQNLPLTAVNQRKIRAKLEHGWENMENEPERVKKKKSTWEGRGLEARRTRVTMEDLIMWREWKKLKWEGEGKDVGGGDNTSYNGGYNNVKGVEKVKVGGLRVEM